jgi:hypothetical protein
MAEIRIFPNSQAKEFKTPNELREYLQKELRSNGEYKYRNHRLVSKIELGTIALFRFAVVIIGWGEVSKPPHQAFITDEHGEQYQGILAFKPSSVKVFESPLQIKELEAITRLTYHYKDNFNTGQPYYKIPMKFRDRIKKKVRVE